METVENARNRHTGRKAVVPKIATPKPAKPSFKFWRLALKNSRLSEVERISLIKRGFDSTWLLATKEAFDINKIDLASLINSSPATLDRKLKAKQPLDSVASERLDRLSQIALLAEQVFEDKEVASTWLTTANAALGGLAPLSLCETELAARQVRRVLHSIEWGGVS